MSVRASLLILLASVGCSREESSTAEAAPRRRIAEPAVERGPTKVPGLVHHEPGALDGSQTPNLGAGPDGQLLLSWTDPVGDGAHAVRVSSREATGWSKPATVVRGDQLFLNWADFAAAVPSGDGRWLAAWLQRASQGKGYGIRWAHSKDQGQRWSDATSLHEHIGGPEYGFVSFAHGPAQGVTAYWLDGRDARGHGEGQMQLRSAVIGPGGELSRRQQVDPRVCDCCQTSAAATPSGPVVVYRDRSQSEVRDIMIAGPAGEEPRRIAADGWTIAGCPVNGPAVSALNDELAVAWFTGAAQQPRVQVAFGESAGTFASVEVGTGEAMIGRVDVEWLDDDAVAVTYMQQSSPGRASVLVRRVSRTGQVGAPLTLGVTDAGTGSGFPRMARTGTHLVWAWTSVEGSRRHVELAEAPIAALEG